MRDHPRLFGLRVAASQERRRQEALKRQRSARRSLTDHARRLCADDDRLAKVHSRAKLWWSEVCTPEWLVDVPDLNGRDHPHGLGWYVIPRPEGRRCVLVACNGRTTARSLSGDVLETFCSALPGGGSLKRDTHTVLDVICANDVYYVLDVMCWASYEVYDCTAEFRFFWLRTKLEEREDARFRALPYFECDPEGILNAYSRAPLPYIRDGLLFYDKRGHYALGLTPLVSIWKDQATTRYFNVDLVLCLEVAEGGVFRTLDGLVISEIDARYRSEKLLKVGDIARCRVAKDDGGGVFAKFDKKCSSKRAAPDSSSKLAFALRHNTRGPLTIDAILQAAQTPISKEVVAAAAAAAESQSQSQSQSHHQGGGEEEKEEKDGLLCVPPVCCVPGDHHVGMVL
ncbi:hypothetical protein CTAYLR_000136 [Chrysophaeum taylorii]|uniref:Snurportin-1 n=1 Tax=Chrysophaeum taylorii TaxID=2483200 RepID=A0AAD7XNE4_9STRA|nr:hypothetical protein CTAYLR_000136 [Chrysophaeum taylorii]